MYSILPKTIHEIKLFFVLFVSCKNCFYLTKSYLVLWSKLMAGVIFGRQEVIKTYLLLAPKFPTETVRQVSPEDDNMEVKCQRWNNFLRLINLGNIKDFTVEVSKRFRNIKITEDANNLIITAMILSKIFEKQSFLFLKSWHNAVTLWNWIISFSMGIWF